MDSTAVAMPPSLVWDLFTDLAACGKDNITLRDIDTLTRRIVECIRAHLPCPSGLLVLQTDKDTRSVVHWGIDHQQEQKLLSQNGHQQNLNMVCLEIAWQQHTIGQLFLGKTAHNATLFSEGFITALRNQLELLIHLHYDEISKIEQTKVSSFSFNDLDIKSQSGIYEALQLFLEHVATFNKAEAAVIYLHNNEHYLQLFASHGLNQNNEKSYVTIQDGFVGQIAKQRVSVIPDSCSDQNHHLPDSDTSSWQSCVGVPLEIQEELLGVLLLLRTEHYPVFQEADIQALEQEIKPAIVLLWNVHLLAQQQQYERELFVLYENAHTISSTNDVEPILSRTVENTAIAMGADTCALHLYDTTDPTVLYEAVSYSSDTNDRKVTLSYSLDEQPIIQQLLQTKERTLTFTHNGTHTNNHLMSRLSEFMGNPSGLIIPLTAQDQTAGLLYIGYNDTHRYFNNVEVNFAHTVANQVALSVINALSQQASQRQTTEFQQLQTISQQLNASQTLDEILTILFEELSTLITFKGIQLCLYEANEQQLHIWRSEGIQTDTSVDNTHYSLSDSLGGWVARYRTPLRLSNLIDPPVKPTVNELVNGDAIHSYIGLPLCIGSQLYGVLELFSSQINAFSAATERILSLVADITTRAVAALHQHEQTDHHLRGRVQQLTALQRISRHLTSTIALDRILSFALKEVLRATPATHAYIALQEGQKDDLEVLDAETLELVGYVAIQGHHNFASYQIMATAGYSAPDTSLLLRKNLSQGTTAAEKALVDGEATIVDEISDVDDRVEEIGPTIASALAIPIFYEDHIVGVVNIHSIQPHAFDHEAVEFVRALTDQIALAIGNAQSYQEQVRQRERLQQRASLLNEMLGIGQALRADRSLEDILEQVAFSVVEIARYRSVLFNLVDANDPDIMRVTTGAGLPLTELERLRNGVWPQVLINKFIDKKYRLGRCFFVPSSDFLAITSDIDIEDIHVTTVQGHREANEWQPDDLLLVPLYSTRAKLLGVMSVDDPFDGQRPTERSLEALAIFADQAAIAIENAYLLREERNQAEHMRALFQVSAATVATFDLDELLMRVYNEIVAYMGTPSFLYVASYDDQTESTCFEIFMREGEILTTQHKQTYPKGGLTGWVIDTGKAQYIHDSAAEEKNLPVQPIHLGETVQSWVGIPLRSQRQIIGVLSVQSFEPYAFSDHHIQFLSTLANQLAVALENTHLFQERERRITELDVINQISRITNSTLDLHKMLGGIYACLTQFLTIDAAYILVRYEKSKEEAFVFKVDKGIREFHKVSGELVPGSLTEYIIRTKQPLLLRDLQKDKAELSFTPVQFGNEELESASWLGVPLLDGDNNVLGIFSIQSYIANTYSDRELAFMTTVASQAALGIQNVWLFDQTQRSADALQGKVGELGTLLEAARVLSSSLKPQEVLDMLMEVVGHQLAVNTVALWTINDKNILLPAAMLGIPESVASTLNVPVGGGLTGQVAATNQPLVIDDVE
ncbi:MAG: GAF domain-containing protein [Chloroflexota bacterium]